MTSTTLTIMSYNLLDFGKSRQQRQQAQLQLLREWAPDVLCVQEFWDDSPGHRELAPRFTEFAAGLGMGGQVVPAPRSHCHLGLLWQPDIKLIQSSTHEWNLWHGLGVAILDVGAACPLRVAVTHLAPSNPQQRFGEAYTLARLADPRQATIVAADWNTPGEDLGYDPEPDLSSLRPDQLVRRIQWNVDPHGQPTLDRRPTRLLHRAGLIDAARHLSAPWQATTGPLGEAGRRIDAFRVSRSVLPALVDYQVREDELTRTLSDHFPIELQVNRDALAQR